MQILKPSRPKPNWFDGGDNGEDSVLSAIDIWVSCKLEEVNKPESNPISSSPTPPPIARQASIPTLLAASGPDPVQASSTSSSTQEVEHNFNHARIMLQEAGITPPKDDTDCWDAWISERNLNSIGKCNT